jgi:hypothetical protein
MANAPAYLRGVARGGVDQQRDHACEPRQHDGLVLDGEAARERDGGG